ncbi:RICIN domain-containing protein [Pseudomonas sp. MWU12-2345]|uniref:RICIN domain-containing protein n=1 Tax=Pseudomonas sp. MWU12-2345 TaxID=2928689 RepID=UPI00200CFA46|nr:RICIN domain-containing protein [Pseudomonas sp. MWU12-2345]
MSKSTDTPDSTTSDQAHTYGSNRAVTIPTGPVKICTALNEAFFLEFKSAEDNAIKIISTATSLFPLWVFKPSSIVGAYEIQFFTAPSMYIATGQSGQDVVANTWGSSWDIWDAGDGLVYIQQIGYGRVLSVWGGGAFEGNRIVLNERGGITAQKFRLKA